MFCSQQTFPCAPWGASDFDPTSHADFGAATNLGVGGAHRLHATFERCLVWGGGGVRVVVCLWCCSCRVVVCASDLWALLSVGRGGPFVWLFVCGVGLVVLLCV